MSSSPVRPDPPAPPSAPGSRPGAVDAPASVFTRRPVVIAVATLCCLLWGSAYPAVKSGYTLFAIAPDDLAGKLVFAGWRFAGAGLVLLAFCAGLRRPLFRFATADWGRLALLGLTQTTLQYVFFYVGLAHTTGVKGSIMNATGTFFSVLLAHLIYHDDRLSARRLTGCLVGFAGVLIVNFSGALAALDFTLLGEGCVIIAAFVLSAASIYGKHLARRLDPLVMTAHQLTLGGLVLLALGYASGGTLTGFTPASTALLGYLVLLSSSAFALWSLLLKHNRVGVVSVFNFLIPIFGALLSAGFLGERILEWKNLAALALTCGGIWLVTRERPTPAPR